MQKFTTVVEFTSQWIKLVAVRPSAKGPDVINLTVKPIASVSTEGLMGEFNACIKELKFTPSPLIISFPRNLVTVRNLHLPSHDTKEIEGMIDLHMSRQVPYPRDQIVGGYQILGSDNLGYTKAMLAIAHRDALQRIIEVLNSVNLFPDRVELSTEGILNWLLFNQKAKLTGEEIYIFLDIDSNFTEFLIADKESLFFSRSIGCGAEQIAIEEVLKAKFISELKQSLVIFQSEEMNKKPAMIFASGALVNAVRLTSLLEAELNIKAGIIEFPKDIAVQIPKSVSISALLGLSIETPRKRISFVMPEVQIRKSLRERSREIILLGSLLMFIFIVISLVFAQKLYNRLSYKTLLENKYQDVKDDVVRLEDMSRKIKLVKEALNSRALGLNCLYEINMLTPPEIVIKTLTFEADGKLTLRGQALAMSDVYKFNSALENSGYFKDIQIKFQSKKKVADRDLSEFEIACPITAKKGSAQ